MNESCHIVPLGPSSMGKTTLVAGIVDAMRNIVDKTGSISVRTADGDALEKDIAALHSARGPLPEHLLAPTTAPVVHEVQIKGKAGGFFSKLMSGNAVLDFTFHDYPGELVHDLPRFTREVLSLADAEVVIVPVDATLLMQASSQQEEVAAHALHRIVEIEELLVEWEKGRARTVGHGLVLFVPMRCEQYFGDNGMDGTQEEGERLAMLVRDRFFSNILDILIFFGQNINCLYVPVDTIGHCRLTESSWDLQTPSFRASFAVEGEPKPYGCEMLALFILEYYTKLRRQNTPNKVLTEMEKTLDSLVDDFKNSAGYKRALRFC